MTTLEEKRSQRYSDMAAHDHSTHSGSHPSQTRSKKFFMVWTIDYNPFSMGRRKKEQRHSLAKVSKFAQSCLTLWDPMDCSLPGSSVHGIFQAIVLEQIAISFSSGSSQPRDRTQVSHNFRQTLYHLSHQGSPLSQVQRITDILLHLYLSNVDLINQPTELFLFQKHR